MRRKWIPASVLVVALGSICFASAPAAGSTNESSLTVRAAETAEFKLPSSVAGVALGALASLIALAVLSAGEGAPGETGLVRRLVRGTAAADLFLDVRLRSACETSGGESAFLRSLSHRCTTLLATHRWQRGASVILSVTLGGKLPPTCFHGKVRRCRSATPDGKWYLLKVDIEKLAADEAQADLLLHELEHAPKNDS